MKISIAAFVVAGLAISLFATACEDSSDQKTDSIGGTGLVLRDAQNDYLVGWYLFKRESENTFTANEKRLEVFKKSIEHAGPNARAKYTKQVWVLEKKNKDMKQRLGEYKDEGAVKCKEFKTNFKFEIDAMGRTMTEVLRDNGSALPTI